MIYFVPEGPATYGTLGLEGQAGYFAPRAAGFGAASAEVVIATFYNFSPTLVRQCIPQAWQHASPSQIQAARLEVADAALRRMLGDGVDDPALARCAALAEAAAMAAAEDLDGRPLFAAHCTLSWPEAPHLRLFWAQTLLREYRGDGHIAALVTHQRSGVEALVLHAASGEVSAGALKATRGWSQEEWEATAERLAADGLVDLEPLRLTETGLALRQQIEDLTDVLASRPYEAIGAQGCEELRELARPFAKVIVADALVGALQ